MSEEILHFKTSSGIKSIVGKDLITDKFVAIFELVKNSYDAKAEKVDIIFENNKIIISDDGCGMSKDDLIDKWLNLAYSDKKEGKFNQDRIFVGSKGIGRFSADRLGGKLLIKTKVKNEGKYHELNISWDAFDQDIKKLFESIDIKYTENEDSQANFDKSYTILEISELHEVWSLNEIDRAKEKLRRLKNPFVIDDGFRIHMTYQENDRKITESIQSNIAEVIKDRSITVEAHFNNNIHVALFDRGEKIYEIKAPNISILKKCPINVSINFLTTSAKIVFKRRMGVTVGQFGNIFIYKNGFRVMPYGEEMADLFGLNIRKGQGYSRYIATRELIGYIEIIDPENNFFREASSRDSGFVNNIYLQELENLYMDYLQRPLEAYVQLIDWGEIRIDQKIGTYEEKLFSDVNSTEVEKFKKYITNKNKELVYFKENMSFEERKPEKQLEKLVEKVPAENKNEVKNVVKDVNTKIKKIKNENIVQQKKVEEQTRDISLLKQQNLNLSKKRTEASYAEQLNHHLTLYSKRLNSVVKLLVELEDEISSDEAKKKLRERIRTIKRTSDEMSIFRDVLSKSDLDTKSPQTLSWIQLLNWHISNNQFSIRVNLINQSTDDDKWKIKSNVVEFILMIDNFINNAEEHKASFIEFEFSDDILNIKSDSNPIDPNYLERIFELGFSTKEHGTGIGLSQVKNFLKKMNMSILAYNKDDLVYFQIKSIVG
ncbi:sensor histidine kinase [Acinetobacter baumannii]